MPIKSSLFAKSWSRVMNGHPQYTQTLLTLPKPLIVLTAQHFRESSVIMGSQASLCPSSKCMLYSDYSARVIRGKYLTEDFAIRTGVKQGCMLPPLLFSLCIAWLMRRATANVKRGITRTLMNLLEDLLTLRMTLCCLLIVIKTYMTIHAVEN